MITILKHLAFKKTHNYELGSLNFLVKKSIKIQENKPRKIILSWKTDYYRKGSKKRGKWEKGGILMRKLNTQILGNLTFDFFTLPICDPMALYLKAKCPYPSTFFTFFFFKLFSLSAHFFSLLHSYSPSCLTASELSFDA